MNDVLCGCGYGCRLVRAGRNTINPGCLFRTCPVGKCGVRGYMSKAQEDIPSPIVASVYALLLARGEGEILSYARTMQLVFVEHVRQSLYAEE